MKKKIPLLMLGACLLLLASVPMAMGATCNTAWVSTTAYNGGATVSYSGVNYTAAYWSQGSTPSTNNGPAGSGQPWVSNGACTGGGGATATATKTATAVGTATKTATAVGTATKTATATATKTATATATATGGGGSCFPAWVSTTAYNGGAQVSYSGVNYTAAYWSQGSTPSTNSGPAGSGQPWVSNGSCSGGGGGGSTPTPTAVKTPTPCQSNCGGGGKLFAPYVDMSLTSGETVASNASSAGLRAVSLAFLVDGGCVANWGGIGGSISSATFPNGSSVASQVNALISQGVSVIISWGGANGSALSSCGNASSAQAMYQSVFNTFPGIAGQDFDIEGGVSTSVLAQALSGLKSANSGKVISYTLPVLPSGLVSAGLAIANAGFRPDTLNVMAMDYGSANDNGGQMGLSAQQAASSTHSQTGDNIGVTPMIGVNDTSTEVFQLSDASSLVSFANSNGYINRLSFWSLGRDNGSCAGAGFASATCSGISQSTYQFSSVFNGF
jgi:chitodextrinase